jgi:hypothetical protein
MFSLGVTFSEVSYRSFSWSSLERVLKLLEKNKLEKETDAARLSSDSGKVILC